MTAVRRYSQIAREGFTKDPLKGPGEKLANQLESESNAAKTRSQPRREPPEGGEYCARRRVTKGPTVVGYS